MKDAWELIEAITELRELEPIANKHNAHIALAGGVLINGHSTKDLDVIVYPRKKKGGLKPLEILAAFGAVNCLKIDYHPDDGKLVYRCTFLNRKVDFFFLA